MATQFQNLKQKKKKNTAEIQWNWTQVQKY